MTNQDSSKILERIVQVAQKAMQPSQYCENMPYLQFWVKKSKAESESDSRPKILYRLMPQLEPEHSKRRRETERKNVDLCERAYFLVRDISTLDTKGYEDDTLKEKLEWHFFLLEQAYLSQLLVIV